MKDKTTNKCMGRAGGMSGTDLVLYTCHNRNNQQWFAP